MKVFLIAAVLLFLIGPLMGTLDTSPVQAGQLADSQEEIQNILQATIRIEVTEATRKDTALTELALGSAVSLGDEVLIVTHNHWGPLLSDDATVEFHAPDGQLLATIPGRQIWSAARYQDEGTLVFKAPEEFTSRFRGKPGNLRVMAPGERLAPGVVVQVVHIIDHKDHMLGVQPMEVLAGFETNQPPVYYLHSLSGQPVREGDSGGGVWFHGALVANIWSTILVPAWQAHAASMKFSGSTDRYYSDTGFAAVLPWKIQP